MSENELFSGVIAIDKPQGMTSHDVVARVRRLYGTKQVGHTGTLDPLATGVLPVMVGRAVKASEYLTSDNKHYIAGMRLGITTDTEDVQGRVLSECDDLPSQEQVEGVLARFRGEVLQIPPMYSALKVGGKKLCDLARKGVEIERTPRPITVYRLELLQCEPSKGSYLLDVECSKGTYIRTLIADIGAALGCGGTMESLRRAKAGSFSLTDTVTLEKLENMSQEERIDALQSVETLFYDWEKLNLPPFFAKLARNGCEVYLDKLGIQAPLGKRFSLYREEDGFFAVGEIQAFPEGNALRVIKLFKL